MKKVLVMLSLGVLFAGSTMAQDTPRGERNRTEQRADKGQKRERLTPEQMATKRTEHLTQQLSLSKKQQREVQELFLKQAQQMQAYRGKDSRTGDKDQKGKQLSNEGREQRKAMHDKFDAELKDILNKDQYNKYVAQRQAMKDKHGKGGRERGQGQQRKSNS